MARGDPVSKDTTVASVPPFAKVASWNESSMGSLGLRVAPAAASLTLDDEDTIGIDTKTPKPEHRYE
jgi:hypothetical protein